MNSTVFGPAPVGEAEAVFRAACAHDHDTQAGFIDQEVDVMDAIAGVLGVAMRQIEPLVARLDMALRRHDARGFAVPRPKFTARAVDVYAVMEALFWNALGDEAERLLKAMLEAELAR